MSMLVAALVFVPLLAIAFAHFIWSMGGTWPIRSEALLAQTVIGRAGVSRMPNRLLTLVVAILVLAAGIAALSLADHDSGGAPLTLLGALLAVVFLGRGWLAYTPGWRARYPSEPFATIDRKTYAPLCLFLGAGFLVLVLMRLL